MTKKQFIKAMYKKNVTVMFVGILTGLAAGVVVTFFALAAEILAERSLDIFEMIRLHPAYIPLLFAALALGAFMVSTLSYLLPALSSNGVPQTEGLSRGLIHVKWYQMLPAMAAASLISIFMGLNAGAEGPCMFIGGMCGDAVSRPFGSTDMERRFQITGGACAGVAVAANAPLTGIVFALEEAHRRFTPSILICSFSAVITAIITRNLLHFALGLEVASSFHGFVLANMPAKAYLYVALAALISGLVGVLFMGLVKLSGKLMRKVTALKGFVRYLIPFLFIGAVGMLTIYATGGGHQLINMLATDGGTKEVAIESIFGSPIAVTLFVLIALRLVALALGIGAGMPSGIFVPIITLGALVGALTSRLLVLMGMDSVFVDSIVLICMAAIFAATVKAPLTAVIFVVEFTWQATLLLPVVLGVFIGYMLSEIFSVKPLYDVLLREMQDRIGTGTHLHRYSTRVEEGSLADGKELGDVLWQEGTICQEIERDGETIAPDSETVLHAGDKLTLCAEVDDVEAYEQHVEEIVKHQNRKDMLKTLSENLHHLLSGATPHKATHNADEDGALSQTVSLNFDEEACLEEEACTREETAQVENDEPNAPPAQNEFICPPYEAEDKNACDPAQKEENDE